MHGFWAQITNSLMLFLSFLNFDRAKGYNLLTIVIIFIIFTFLTIAGASSDLEFLLYTGEMDDDALKVLLCKSTKEGIQKRLDDFDIGSNQSSMKLVTSTPLSPLTPPPFLLR